VINVDKEPGTSIKCFCFCFHISLLLTLTGFAFIAYEGFLKGLLASSYQNHLIQQMQEFPGLSSDELACNAMALMSMDLSMNMLQPKAILHCAIITKDWLEGRKIPLPSQNWTELLQK
jgi:hypothetical protein